MFMTVERVGHLCLNLANDPSLRSALAGAGLDSTQWETLVDAVRHGAGSAELTPVLDAVEDAAAAAGVDGVTTGDRRFEPLPDASPGFRATRGWRCPHPDPCGHVRISRVRAAPVCPLTTDPLTLVKVVSG